MPRLRQCDLATFSKVLETLYASEAHTPLGERILASLHGVVPCDFASFSLLDGRTGHCHSRAMTPGVSGWPGTEVYQHFFWEDPLVRHVVRTATHESAKISDLVSLREYRSLGVYAEIFGRVGCDRRMGFGVLNTYPVDLSISLNRARRDFTEEERGLLDLLRPHVAQAYAQANAQQTLLQERAEERARLGDTFGVGLVEIDDRAQVRWITPRAEGLLTDFFPEERQRPAGKPLPGGLQAALGRVPRYRGSPAPAEAALEAPKLAWHFPGPGQRRLRVRLVFAGAPGHRYLLLEETSTPNLGQERGGAPGLTTREVEVLHWLREGKTNWEIGAILGNAEKTVGKHLENIFRKLKVENRTAAVRAATEADFGGLRGEASRSLRQTGRSGRTGPADRNGTI